ncbi:hypothetical protein BFS35_006820 [Macrococcoides goetzii]|uniref:Replicative helicase inhibitor G39P N-terminal domain-containing protein n=1 Tax=Macrococcoides goetzii TaxID=1891097 RepID=A0A395GBB3_9STAP|nr:hypothetical protein [Macrococcus goetzii]RAI81274.1 hypothetical protein BFS35_006820 [Macrococcus goetzii]
MLKEERNQIIKKVKDLYPNMKLNETIIKVWAKELDKADYVKTDMKLEAYYRSSRYAPHISDIAVYQEINPAQLEYEELERERERNKVEYDPIKRQQSFDKLNQFKEVLQNELQ